jgi:hypothetical protein
MIGLALAAALALAPTDVPPLADEEVPEGTLQGPSSSRYAKDVVITFGTKAVKKDAVLAVPGTKQDRGTSAAPTVALGQHALYIARRHFEDAAWDTRLVPGDELKGKAKKPPAKGRVVVIKSISLEVRDGPSYTAVVEVERVEDGRRRGSATGRAVAAPDNSRARRNAAFAPGLFGVAAQRKVSRPDAERDTAAIEQATLRALDSALLQLAAVWAGEQATAEALEKANRANTRKKR